MRFSVLAYITLAAAAAPPPVTSSSYIEDGRSSNKSVSIEEGWEAVKDAIHGQFHHLLIPERRCLQPNRRTSFFV
ncbi:hypothetical protein DEU56DRAFT_302362 [Suillus clintonianus]|uniref:uncharacterized protein n=1 Tax=Suillus clintonianus TaxID=1904413 RepID=UPI001B85C8F7|nr:uncharacterized protein DEU56DRAFT_302362 [Suillus clintonianus]KAG2139736.1 hypothetical protein DEU56DRAFT_302362 [Suillus clintonianus]